MKLLRQCPCVQKQGNQKQGISRPFAVTLTWHLENSSGMSGGLFRKKFPGRIFSRGNVQGVIWGNIRVLFEDFFGEVIFTGGFT